MAAGLAVAVVVLAACSNSSSTTKGGSIQIGWIGPLTGGGTHATYTLTGVQAAAKAINAAGGVNGKSLKVVSCDDQFDPNKAADCGRQMVSAKVVAVVGANSGLGDRWMPLLEAAKIPVVGNIAASPSENKSELSFPIGSGAAGETYGIGILLGKVGCTKVAVGFGDYAGAKFVAQSWLEVALKKVNLTPIKQVAVPSTATDLSSYAESLAGGGADCVAYIDAAAKGQRMVQAIHKSHPAVKLVFPQTVFGPQAIGALGADADGLYLSGGFTLPTSYLQNATIAQFNKEIDAYGGKDDRNEFMSGAWAATHLVATMLAKTTAVDSASLVSTMKAAGAQDLGGGLASFNWASPVALVPGARTYGATVFFSQVKNGVPEPLLGGKAVDLTQPQAISSVG